MNGVETAPAFHAARPGCSRRGLVLYFLRLGALGFGGPVALANHMRRDLVEKFGWMSEAEYDEGLAIATACPGPLAYQLAVYCGHLRSGLAGGLLVALAFALAPFLLVTGAAALYVRYHAAWPLRALFYGVAPVVVALILKACRNLGKKTLKREPLAWIFFLVALAVTVIVQQELIALFLAAGLLGIFLFAKNSAAVKRAAPPPEPAVAPRAALLPLAASAGATAAGPLFLFFFKTGLLVFGSGLVIVPFLKSYVVDQYHWLDTRQFLDAVAIGMISPGPVVITATFVGYLLSGFAGAVAATAGIFTPPVLFTVLATPLLRRHRANARLRGFIRGVTVAVIGVLTGTGCLVARSAVGDPLTAAIALAALLAVIRFEKIPEPLLVLAGALIGLAAYRAVQPPWLLR